MNTYCIEIDLVKKNYTLEDLCNYLHDICGIREVTPTFLPPCKVMVGIKTKNPIPPEEMLKLKLSGTKIHGITPGEPVEKANQGSFYINF